MPVFFQPTRYKQCGSVRDITSGSYRPSIFTAVQELGLLLEPKKSSIELSVIDLIEKPDPN
jgi:uncharacterized protein (TIGR03435 family)